MNVCIPITEVSPQNIYFTEKRKNIIIDGVFAKIVYSNAFVSLNGLYTYINEPTSPPQLPLAHLSDTLNTANMDYTMNPVGNNVNGHIARLCRLEKDLLEQYKTIYGVSKNITYTLQTQLLTNHVSFCSTNTAYSFAEVSDGNVYKPPTAPVSIWFHSPEETSMKSMKSSYSSNTLISLLQSTGARECDNSHKHYDTGGVPRRIDVKSRSAHKLLDEERLPYTTIHKNTYNCLKISGIWENATSIGLTYKWMYCSPFTG